MDEEQSKAVQEVAKTTGQAIEACEKVGAFLNKLLGSGLSELGEAFHDWAKCYRYKNLLKIHDKIEAIHNKRSIEGKTIPLPPRYAIPIIQNASQEDDESIQQMWAGLMANATDPNKQVDIQKIYIEILSSLEPLDARILNFLSKQGWNLIPGAHGGGITLGMLRDQLGVEEEKLKLSLQNLARLGCLIDECPQTMKSLDTIISGLRITNPKTMFRPSDLGFSLVATCED